MRLILIVLIVFCIVTANAQDDKHIKGKMVDVTYKTIVGMNNNITVYLDCFQLNREDKKK